MGHRPEKVKTWRWGEQHSAQPGESRYRGRTVDELLEVIVLGLGVERPPPILVPLVDDQIRVPSGLSSAVAVEGAMGRSGGVPRTPAIWERVISFGFDVNNNSEVTL